MIEKEKMRKFIFEEFMKRDPDQITFEKPDSGSGISEGGDDESENMDNEDDE